MFPRRLTQPGSGGPLGRAGLLKARAHLILQDGAWLPAESLFAGLAEAALQRRISVAALPSMQVAVGHVSGRVMEKGRCFIRKGLGLLADGRRWRTPQRFEKRFVNHMGEDSLNEEARKISEWSEMVLPLESFFLCATYLRRKQHRPNHPRPVRNMGMRTIRKPTPGWIR